MQSILNSFFLLIGLAAVGIAAKPPQPTIASVSDHTLASAEKEIVSLAEAMPEDKYNFAPTTGEFTGVRTFAQQMTHIASVNYEVAAAILEEKNPVEMGKNENGPETLRSKEAIVKYLKDSFTYAHKAMASLTNENYTAQVKSPFGGGQSTRAELAPIPVWHSFDHYGQAVVYARLNGIVPPASRK